jgi:hypothetical protein
MRQCRPCGEAKPLDEFYRRNARTFRTECKACIRMGVRERVRGITATQYLELLRQQDGTCAICGERESNDGRETLSVDHCHQTGAIRGLLCAHCNRGLGMFRDNRTLLLAAVDYLEAA